MDFKNGNNEKYKWINFKLSLNDLIIDDDKGKEYLKHNSFLIDDKKGYLQFELKHGISENDQLTLSIEKR